MMKQKCNWNNCIVQSQEKAYFEADSRIRYKIHLLDLYITKFPSKWEKYARQLINDPDLSRVDSEVHALMLNMIGVGLFVGNNDYFANWKKCLKKALALTKSPKLIAIICHNLAVMNYYEISFHNDKLNENLDQDKINKKIAQTEMIYNELGLEDKIKTGEHKDGMIHIKATDLRK